MGSDLSQWLREPSTVAASAERATWLRLLDVGEKMLAKSASLADFTEWLRANVPPSPYEDLLPKEPAPTPLCRVCGGSKWLPEGGTRVRCPGCDR